MFVCEAIDACLFFCLVLFFLSFVNGVIDARMIACYFSLGSVLINIL